MTALNPTAFDFNPPNNRVPKEGFNLYFLNKASRIIIANADFSVRKELDIAKASLVDEKYVRMNLLSVTTSMDTISFDQVDPDQLPGTYVAYSFDMSDGDSGVHSHAPIIVIGTGDMRVKPPGSVFTQTPNMIATFDITFNNPITGVPNPNNPPQAAENFYFEWGDSSLIIYAKALPETAKHEINNLP